INGTNGVSFNRDLSTPQFDLDETNRVGSSVADAGDVNGDGINDLIIGANQTTFVVYGNNRPWSKNFDLDSLSPGDGFKFSHLYKGPDIRTAGIGDINNDGLDDIAIALPQYGNS